jgi:methionine-rich copper-binding protein CopC
MKTTALTKLFNAILLALCLFTTPALLAHNSIKTTTPSDEAVMHEAPAELMLSFTDSTYLMTVEVNNAQGENVLTDFSAPQEAASSFSVALPAGLAVGVYTVQWMVIGDDTHEVKGQFTYTVSAS